MSLSKIKISVFVLLVLFVSCSTHHKPGPIPSDVLGHKQMVDVICDLHLADGILTAAVVPPKDLPADTVLYSSVFAKHGTTSTQFQKSVLYYTHHNMIEFKLIYAEAVEKLNHKKAELMGW